MVVAVTASITAPLKAEEVGGRGAGQLQGWLWLFLKQRRRGWAGGKRGLFQQWRTPFPSTPWAN